MLAYASMALRTLNYDSPPRVSADYDIMKVWHASFLLQTLPALRYQTLGYQALGYPFHLDSPFFFCPINCMYNTHSVWNRYDPT